MRKKGQRDVFSAQRLTADDELHLIADSGAKVSVYGAVKVAYVCEGNPAFGTNIYPFFHGLLEIAKKAHDLPGINGYVTGDAALVPQVLANGHIALAATLIINDDAIFKDGVGVEIEGEFIETGTTGYDEFIDKLRQA